MPAVEDRNNDMEIFPWNEHLNTGFEIIDNQHRQLVAILNSLARHVAYGHDDAPLAELIQSLVAYAEYHFQTEEAIWAEYIPEAALVEQHQRTHRSFFESVNELALQQQTSAVPNAVLVLFEFITRWLSFHILDCDRRLAIMAIEMRDHGVSLDEARHRADQAMSGVIRVLM